GRMAGPRPGALPAGPVHRNRPRQRRGADIPRGASLERGGPQAVRGFGLSRDRRAPRLLSGRPRPRGCHPDGPGAVSAAQERRERVLQALGLTPLWVRRNAPAPEPVQAASSPLAERSRPAVAEGGVTGDRASEILRMDW